MARPQIAGGEATRHSVHAGHLRHGVKDRPLRLRGLDDNDLFLRAWFLSNFLLICVPTDFQIHMLNGWQIPIAVLASKGLFLYVHPMFREFARRGKWRWSSEAIR